MSLQELVEQTIDEVIRLCCPDDSEDFQYWDSRLERLEGMLGQAPTGAEREGLLAQVVAQRVSLAYDIGHIASVLRLGARFIERFPAGAPGFFLVSTLYSRALHATGAHEQEIQQTLALAHTPEMQGSEYIYLLEGLARRHPGSIPSNEVLASKMVEAASLLCSQGYDLPLIEGAAIDVEEVACQAADKLRRFNRARAQALLGGE